MRLTFRECRHSAFEEVVVRFPLKARCAKIGGDSRDGGTLQIQNCTGGIAFNPQVVLKLRRACLGYWPSESKTFTRLI